MGGIKYIVYCVCTVLRYPIQFSASSYDRGSEGVALFGGDVVFKEPITEDIEDDREENQLPFGLGGERAIPLLFFG